MKQHLDIITAYTIMGLLIVLVGIFQSWPMALAILNLCLISAVMTMGANIQWGYAGLINFGIMGFTALGGLAAVLVSVPPVREAWQIGGFSMILSLFIIISIIFSVKFILKKFPKSNKRNLGIIAVIIIGVIIARIFFGPAVESIEAVNPATTGFLGGLGLPIIFSWIVGALFAAGVAYVIGKITLGLRADYLAIATLLISEIVIAIVKHEDWLARGVKNVIGLKRPVPYEVNLQSTDWFINLAKILDLSVIEASSVFVKLCYTGLFSIVVILILILCQKALYSPWGRMMRAIRDNEEAANAMGKNVVKQHLQIFILGSAVVGIAGAMLTTYDGLFTPGSYQPLRFTFLIWVMVIIGGSGNNFGAILGGFAVWFVWIEAAPVAFYLINFFTSGLAETNTFKKHLIESIPYFRYLMMGTGLLLIMRYRPQGIIPEKIRHL